MAYAPACVRRTLVHAVLPLSGRCRSGIPLRSQPAGPCPDQTKISTMCPGSSDPFYIVSYYIKRVTTSWTHSNK